MKNITKSTVIGNLTNKFTFRPVTTADGRKTCVLNFSVAEHEGENTKFYRAAVWGKQAEEANARMAAMTEEERKGYFVEVTGTYQAATNPKFNDEIANASIRFIQPKAAYAEAQKAEAAAAAKKAARRARKSA